MSTRAVTVAHHPDWVFIEKGVFKQSVSFEFRFRTNLDETVELKEIAVEGFDEKDNFLFRLPLNDFGLDPPISIVSARRIEPGKTLEIFNPLSDFPLDYAIHRLLYRFRFQTEKSGQTKTEISIKPVVYEQKRPLILPFMGKCIVTEGHDFLTHHRRNFPFMHPLIQQIGITGNSSRFAYDFVLLKGEESVSEKPPCRNEDFYGWDKPVLCPGEGKIAGVAHDLADNEFSKPPDFNVETHLKEPEASMAQHFGNYTLIDHGHEEFSVLAHMRKGSIHVELDDRVTKGEILGRVGTSGDSFFPHIHFQVQNGRSFLKSEGLPSRFERFNLLLGRKRRLIKDSCPSTGMVIAAEL